MLDIILPYILPPFPTTIDFLALKQHVIHQLHWRVAFYIHIITGLLALMFGVTQFSKKIMHRYPSRHRTIGKMYIIMVLILAAPSGLVLAFDANGGNIAQIGFMVQAYLWWMFTFLAYHSVRKKLWERHSIWMIRSYAFTLSAITLRAMTYFFDSLALPLHPSEWYIFSAWASWGINILIAEIIIRKGIVNYYLDE